MSNYEFDFAEGDQFPPGVFDFTSVICCPSNVNCIRPTPPVYTIHI